jgi:hypothetical protein
MKDHNLTRRSPRDGSPSSRPSPRAIVPPRGDAQPDLVIDHFDEDDTYEDDGEVGVFDSISNYTVTTQDSTYFAQEGIATPAKLIPIKHTPPHLDLRKISIAPQTQTSASPQQLDKPLPSAPGYRGGWGASPSPSPAGTDYSPFDTTGFTEKGASSLTDASPVSTALGSAAISGSFPHHDAKQQQQQQQQPAHEHPAAAVYGHFSVPASVQIDEMEDELKGISSELAASIRREMDLEDLVERLQAERDSLLQGGGGGGGGGNSGSKRTSDYFSDSGVSSAKFSEYDQSRDEVERVQRKAEQDMAQLRLELGNRLQDERSRRMALDAQVQELSARAARMDLAELDSQGSTGRVKELEKACEDLRRRLAEERDAKTNLEDLLEALRGSLEEAVNERDNLRDEIVPSLKARVEGLETEAAEYATLTYESTKMQQQLQSLKEENDKLNERIAAANAAPVVVAAVPAVSSLKRSNSTMETRLHPKPVAALDLARSGSSLKAESRDALAERLKDVEGQRDALHMALRSLLDRQEFQNRENEKKIKALETERDRLLASSPRAAGFEREVANLKAEIRMLRRRAEEAIDQKWQIEKGLGHVKMDLDRAEQEIAALRELLRDADVPAPDVLAPHMGAAAAAAADSAAPVPAISGPLAKAYQDVQAVYADALARIRQLDGDAAVGGEAAQLAMGRLERTLTAVATERDAAVGEADALKTQLEQLGAAEGVHVESERALATELAASAARVEELAAQVRQQLATNATLRDRLADTIERGDADRRSNVERINSLQNRMRVLEDALVAAQNAAEDRAARHEAELAAMRATQQSSPQLRRACTCPSTGGHTGHKHHISALSPSLSRSAPRRSPATTPGLGPMLSPRFAPSRPPPPKKTGRRGSNDSCSVCDDEDNDEGAVMNLRSRVAELEALLHEADEAMQEVVEKMSTAQMEVIELRDEKEAAMRETRRLQRVLEEESQRGFEDRFKSLAGLVR